MRKKLYTIVIILFLILIIFTAGTSLAKYYFGGETDIIMDIGKFIVKINDTDVTNGYTGSFVLDDFQFTGSDLVKDGVLAPGSTGYYDFILDASECDVSVRFDIGLSDYSERIHVYLDGDDYDTLVKTDTDTYSGLILLNDENKVRNLKIVLDWPYGEGEGYNVGDTTLSSSDVQIPFTINLKQYTGDGLTALAESNLIIDLNKTEMIYDAGTTTWLNTVQTNATVKDNVSGTTYNYEVNSSIPSRALSGTQGSYYVNYSYTNEGKVINRFAKLILAKPSDISFNTCSSYETNNTTITCSSSVATLTSGGVDPYIYIPLSEQNYVNTSIYRYVAVRYKVSGSLSHTMTLCTEENPDDDDYMVSSSLTSDGKFHEVVYDLWSKDYIKNQGYIKGLRFYYTNQSNATIKVDYIKFLKTSSEVDYIYFNDFDGSDTVTTLASRSGVNYTISDSILSMTSTSNDPMIYMQTSTSFDANKYYCIYVKYKLASGVSTRMEFFMIRQPTNQTYAVANNITGNGAWQTTVIDMSTNSNILTKGTVDGWRFDPISVTGTQIDVDYIGISDRCMN